MTICPCCGLKFEGDLFEGCAGCGARAVGAPLARPEHELPSYGRTLFVGLVGGLMVTVFLGSTLAALFERTPLGLDFWSVVAAGETAAWRLKWAAAPATIFALWSGWRLCATMRREPSRFLGLDIAHTGLASSALVGVLIATLIGVTVPERLRQRLRGLEAAQEVPFYTFQRAALEYQARYKTLPADLEDLRRLPDPDGSIAAVVSTLKQAGTYKPSALEARLPEKKSRSLRGAVVRPASVNSTAEDAPDGGISFTNYELRLPGEDKILGTSDDWVMRDGLIIKPHTGGRRAERDSAPN
ncbi:MAG TPA: hypothetical protein VF507_09085 [Pyrinomonadaceae bacterium]